jgi:hypothetical protein
MDNLVEQLRSGVDNVDGGELGGVVLTMNLAANRIEELEMKLEELKLELENLEYDWIERSNY